MLDIKMLKEKPEDLKNYYKIQNEYELEGKFDVDIDPIDYSGALPVDENFDFIKKGFKNWIKKQFYLCGLRIYTNKICKMLKLEITGKENLKKVKGGAVVTCNHISKYDSFPVRKALGADIYYVAADFNNWKGKMGDIARNTGYLPLSNKFSVMRKFTEAIDYHLKRGKKVLIYPEQAMWRDYKKVRPFKNGAFHYAVKNNVPVLPLFITLRPSGIIEDGVEFNYFTLHILSPIYPKAELSAKENLEFMRKLTYNECKKCYEETYNEELKYTTLDPKKIKI